MRKTWICPVAAEEKMCGVSIKSSRRLSRGPKQMSISGSIKLPVFQACGGWWRYLLKGSKILRLRLFVVVYFIVVGFRLFIIFGHPGSF